MPKTDDELKAELQALVESGAPEPDPDSELGRALARFTTEIPDKLREWVGVHINQLAVTAAYLPLIEHGKTIADVTDWVESLAGDDFEALQTRMLQATFGAILDLAEKTEFIVGPASPIDDVPLTDFRNLPNLSFDNDDATEHDP